MHRRCSLALPELGGAVCKSGARIRTAGAGGRKIEENMAGVMVGTLSRFLLIYSCFIGTTTLPCTYFSTACYVELGNYAAYA